MVKRGSSQLVPTLSPLDGAVRTDLSGPHKEFGLAIECNGTALRPGHPFMIEIDASPTCDAPRALAAIAKIFVMLNR